MSEQSHNISFSWSSLVRRCLSPLALLVSSLRKGMGVSLPLRMFLPFLQVMDVVLSTTGRSHKAAGSRSRKISAAAKNRVQQQRSVPRLSRQAARIHFLHGGPLHLLLRRAASSRRCQRRDYIGVVRYLISSVIHCVVVGIVVLTALWWQRE
jgi:hypothetical protein